MCGVSEYCLSYRTAKLYVLVLVLLVYALSALLSDVCPFSNEGDPPHRSTIRTVCGLEEAQRSMLITSWLTNDHQQRS